MITNVSKPNTSLSNTDKISGSETWATISTTWATEARTWIDTISLMSNTTLEGITFLWAYNSQPWSYQLPWQVSTGMTNIAKP